MAQPAPGGPPAVGVVRVERQQITETEEFIGRIQAVGRVSLVARVTAFLDKRNFVEGSEIKQGDLLYVLEQAPSRRRSTAPRQASTSTLRSTATRSWPWSVPGRC